MNLNNIVRKNLSVLFADQIFYFTNRINIWSTSSRIPQIIEENIELTGRMQPLDTQTIEQLGFNIRDYQYFRVYISNITPTQADKIRQLGCSTFTYNGRTYQIEGKIPFDVEGWRELFCHLIE